MAAAARRSLKVKGTDATGRRAGRARSSSKRASSRTSSAAATSAVSSPVIDARGAATIDVDGTPVRVTNLDKVLYPKAGFIKGQVIDYYLRVADAMLPHLRGRKLTRKRYPNGVDEPFFFEKNCPPYHPKYVHLSRAESDRRAEGLWYCVADNRATLAWLANLAAIELHVLLSRGDDVTRPTHMVFDLDPGPPANILDCIRVGLRMRDILASLGLQSLAKTSGGKGLHLYVPLNTPITFEQTKSFSRMMAEVLERDEPAKVTATMSKAERPGKVFIDWSQNDEHKTTAAVYTLRARERPTVSTPVTWDELTSALKRRKPESLVFEAKDVLKRVETLGDLFEPVLTLKQRLPKGV